MGQSKNNEQNILEDRIWYELFNAKFKEIYFGKVLGKKMEWYKWINICITIFSFSGVLSFNDCPIYTLITLIVTTIFLILNLLFQNIVPNERQINKMEEVVSFYFKYVNQIESLWFSYKRNLMSEDQLQKEFYILKATEQEIERIQSSIISKNIKSIEKKANNEANKYISSIFKK